MDRVAFVWRARFPVLGPLSMRVIVSYDGTEGRLEVRLLGLPLQREEGPELAHGQAFRYLAEIAWAAGNPGQPSAHLARGRRTDG